MTPTEAAIAIAADLAPLLDGETKTLGGETFRAAFESPISASASLLGFRAPIIGADTGFRMRYPQWLLTYNQAADTYTATKPRGNPYA